MKRFMIILVVGICVLAAGAGSLYAAVGCTLNDPDRDVRRIFPESTGYKTEFITIKERGGKVLLGEIEEKLGEEFEPVYETIDAPYAYYTILKRKEPVGYICGVNQKGTYGGMQLILAADLNGRIIDFYYQKLSSPEARKFRDKNFTGQFIGMTLADFYNDVPRKKITDPTEKSHEDFQNTLRGLKKNLILLDEFKLDNMYNGEWEKLKVKEGKI
jgi:hypothetical protein